jgi:LmbE family N-acetylglucosaminyl deacetylase
MNKKKEIAIIVAHPDDETIWAGGTILMRKDSSITILSLCRGSDPDRALKFQKAIRELGARGAIGDLDDGPGQTPLKPEAMRQEILSLLPGNKFDLVLTHSPFGEYTRHRRHEETGEVVASMWEAGEILTPELWIFAYSDGGRGGIDDPATPVKEASLLTPLPEAVWQRKMDIITGIYGFNPGSYEAIIAQRVEAFWSFSSPSSFRYWTKKRRILS